MPIHDADATGFCHGVERAVRLAEHAGRKGAEVKSSPNGPNAVIYGHLVHNPQQVGALEDLGMEHIASWRDRDPGVLVVRTHGIAPGELKDIKQAGWKVVDATCPLVTRTHNRAEALRKAGYPLAVIGKAEHPEVKALTQGDYGEVMVLQDPSEVAFAVPGRWIPRLGVVIQSTFPPTPAKAIVGELAIKVIDLKVYNTICDVTQTRADTAAELAREVEVMVVVGGHHSANTRQIADACRQFVTTHHVEMADELEVAWFAGKHEVGLASGLSTPNFETAKVRARVLDIIGE